MSRKESSRKTAAPRRPRRPKRINTRPKRDLRYGLEIRALWAAMVDAYLRTAKDRIQRPLP